MGLLNKFKIRIVRLPVTNTTFILGSLENKALENEDRSMKHPNLENEAPKNSKTKTPKLETGLSFINTRQCLANTAAIKHDTESNAVQIYSSRTVSCCKCVTSAAWEAMQFGRDQKTENPQTISRMLLYNQEKPIRRQSPTHSRPLSSPLSSVAQESYARASLSATSLQTFSAYLHTSKYGRF